MRSLYTYPEWCVALEDFSTGWVDLDLELLHAISTVCQEGWEELLELVLDGQGGAHQGHLGVLDIGDAGWGSWHEFVSHLLES